MSVTVESPSRRPCDLKRLSPEHKSLDAELYGLGHTIRHLQPPGGKENGVFDAYKLPGEVLTPRKKVKDFQKSHVFDAGEPLPPRPVTPLSETTHHHLFPSSPPKPNKARHNHQKSMVFKPDSPKQKPVPCLKKNPITGDFCRALDETERHKRRDLRNPITFEGVKERSIHSRCTQPPGGKCTLVLEYIE